MENGQSTQTKHDLLAGHYLVHLMGCALHGREARPKPDSISWEQVYRAAEYSSVEGLAFFGMSTLKENSAQFLPEGKLWKRWKSAMNVTCCRMLYFDEERTRILKAMDARGLSRLPLKGVRLAYYYPQPGMRSMSDNDILYGFVEEDPQGGFRICGQSEAEQERTLRRGQKAMTELMEGLGYTTDNLLGTVDAYLKKPFYNFEMHRALFGEGHVLYEYYKNPWKRAVQSSENPLDFFFSDEDEYLFMIAHAFKHYDVGGCGVRFLADVDVFLQTKGASMDWGYVRTELQKMGLAEFEAGVRRLVQAALVEGAGSLEKTEEELLDELLGCGTYGTVKTFVEKHLKNLEKENGGSVRRAKLRYLWSRLVPTKEYCKQFHPFFYRHRYLMPFLLMFRVGRGMLTKPQRMLTEWRELWSAR